MFILSPPFGGTLFPDATSSPAADAALWLCRRSSIESVYSSHRGPQLAVIAGN